MTIVVRAATGEADLDEVRRLIREFVAWHRERNVADIDLVDAYFDEAFERELRELPGEYAPPAGELLVAWDGEQAVGCVASRRLDDDSCEMKRMFVSADAQGRGAGRALAVELIARATARGYRWMYLDTSRRQREAIALYRSLGFLPRDPDPELAPRLKAWLAFFRLELSRET